MLSNMKPALGAAAEEQRDLQELEEASLAGQEDAESNVRIDVRTDDNEGNTEYRAEPIQNPVTEGSARKPIGREQPRQQDQAHGQEEQEQTAPRTRTGGACRALQTSRLEVDLSTAPSWSSWNLL